MNRAGWLVLLALSGCPTVHGENAPADGGGDAHDAGEPTDAGWEEGWCAHLATGPAGAGEFPQALSALHAHVRYFGAEPRARAVDDALVAALRTRPEVEPSVLVPYGRALDSVCVGPPDERPLGVASVEPRGAVAIVRPGTGPLSIPPDVAAWALDLRNLSDAPGLEAAVSRALAEVLAAPLPATSRRVFVRTGLTDEGAFASSIYSVQVDDLALRLPSPRAPTNKPLAVLTSERMPPAAAAIAVLLRVSGAAYLFGPPVHTSVAEAQRRTLFGSASVAVRDADLVDALGRLPDVVPSDGPEAQLDTLASMTRPMPLAARVATRRPIAVRDDFNDVHDATLDVATLRAALLAAHGAAKLYFPYFTVLSDETDARLTETLALAPRGVAGRSQARDVLRRLGNALHDGHGWVYDFAGLPSQGSLPLVFEQVDQQVVVARSYTNAVSRGDVVVSVNGVDSATWLAAQLRLTYGANAGHRFFTALSELQDSGAPVLFGLRDAVGMTRSIRVSPVAQLPDADLYSGSLRPHGWLTDLGAADVYYFNLDGRHVVSDADLEARLAQAATARGLVLDLRGHPANGGATWDPYVFLRRIIRSGFDTPKYRVPVYTGIGQVSQLHPYEQRFTPLSSPSFSGKVVLLIDGRAVSFAEDFAMMLVAARRVTVVGQPSAGTTGSVTGLMLPGGFAMFLTGMEARWPDGRDFFGSGIVPDVLVNPPLSSYATGPDAFLTAALTALP